MTPRFLILPVQKAERLALQSELEYAARRCADRFDRIGEAMFQAGACAALCGDDPQVQTRMWAIVDAL